jgi:thiamine biosynthesis lipoprotein
MRRIEHVMGFPVAIDVRGAGVPAGAMDSAFAWLRHVDALFSTYRDDSEIARLNRGALREERADPLVREVLGACRGLRDRTAGAFDAEAAARTPSAERRPGCGGGRAGAVEPAGYVKGWAIAGAWDRLARAGARDAVVDGGGDLVVRGRPDRGRAWRVGIQHPDRDDRVAAVLELRDLCVATSGAYRRGGHIVDPATGRPARGLRSVSCVGADLAVADALATASYAMGARGAQWLARQPDVEAMAIDEHDHVLTTPGFDALRAPDQLTPPPERNPRCHR